VGSTARVTRQGRLTVSAGRSTPTATASPSCAIETLQSAGCSSSRRDRASASASIARLRSLSSDLSKYQVKRPGHLGEIKRLDEQTRVSDLPPAAAAHEAPKLFLIGPSLPRRLFLEGAEGSKLSLSVNDLFHGGGTKSADQLVLQVSDAHVETESFHIGASEVGAEASPLETALELALLCRVTETCQPDVKPLRAEQIQEACYGLRTPNLAQRKCAQRQDSDHDAQLALRARTGR
jgi:hypothetical protein